MLYYLLRLPHEKRFRLNAMMMLFALFIAALHATATELIDVAVPNNGFESPVVATGEPSRPSPETLC